MDAAIGKLFPDGTYMMVIIFLDTQQIMESSCIKVRKNAKVRWKTGNIIRNLQLYLRKTI